MFGYQPEVYVQVSDYYNRNLWCIKAISVSYTYDENYNYTNDFQLVKEFAPDPTSGLTGFDFIKNESNEDWEDLAFAKYRFDISRSEYEPALFSFFIDFRTCLVDFYDITLLYYINQNNEITVYWRRSNSPESHLVFEGAELNYWDMVSLTEDKTCFFANIYPHNYAYNINGNMGDFGELYIDDVAYVSGTDLFTTLKGNTHKFNSYSSPVGIVTLKIYDVLGSEITTLVNEEKSAGKYEVSFNASSLASGVYIYKIQSGDFVSSKKMILIK